MDSDSVRPRHKRKSVPNISVIKVDVARVPTRKRRHAMVTVEKDKLEKEKCPGIVHRITCAGSEHVYSGETGNFGKRLRQHKNDIENKHVATNPLAEHTVSTGHDIDWDSAKIIGKEKNKTTRLRIESLHIQTKAHKLNRNSGNLLPIYTRCLRHIMKTI